MRNLILSAATMLILSIIIYLFGIFIGVPSTLVSGICAIPIMGLKNLYEILEIRDAKRGKQIRFSDFQLNKAYLFILCLVMFSAMFYTSGIIALIMIILAKSGVGTIFSQISSVLKLATTISNINLQLYDIHAYIYMALTMRIVAICYVCRWVVSRSGNRVTGFAITSIAIIIYCISIVVIVFIESTDYEGYNDLLDIGLYIFIFTDSDNFAIVFTYICAAAIAAYFSKEYLYMKHIEFYLSKLPEETRVAVFEIIKDEIVLHNKKSQQGIYDR